MPHKSKSADPIVASDAEDDDVPLQQLKQRKASKSPKRAPVIIDDEEDDNSPVSEEEEEDERAAARKKKSKKKKKANSAEDDALEKEYQKFSTRQKIFARPDRYIGSTEAVTEAQWVLNSHTKRLEYREVTYVPGIVKLFDEILVNAADNKQRDPENMTTVKVTIDPVEGRITIWNNGRGIPIAVHPKYDVYIPEMVFSQMNTSSNYDDTKKRTTGGRFGEGAKLTNMFSSEFTIETCGEDAEGRRRRYTQTFRHNNSKKGREDPVIKSVSTKNDYTQVSYIVDWSKFQGAAAITQDLFDLLAARVYEIAGTSKLLGGDKPLKVYLNNELLPIKSFEQWTHMHFPVQSSVADEDGGDDDVDMEAKYDDENEDGSVKKKVAKKPMTFAQQTGVTSVYQKLNDRWEVVVCANNEKEFQQRSFVNAVCTTKGGTHVRAFLDKVLPAMRDKLKKKMPALQPKDIQKHMWVFLNCLVENPAYDSPTKERLTTDKKNFGEPALEVPDKFMKRIMDRTDIVARLQDVSDTREQRQLKATDGPRSKGRLTNIPKLEDANNAGGKKAEDCYLILTEGDSAKALAVAGLSVVGRDNYAVFPLKGKLLNVREATTKQVLKNSEITALKQILGLQTGKKYTSAKGLRYGHILLMSDQDSVAAATPLLLRDTQGQLHIKRIDEIGYQWKSTGVEHETAHTHFQVWSEQGWTEIDAVIRHRVGKRMYRVVTDKGCVDVTEDHSLLNDRADRIAPSQLKVTDRLLHSFPEALFNVEDITHFWNPERAYNLGLFHRGAAFDDAQEQFPLTLLNAPVSVRKHFLSGYFKDELLDEQRETDIAIDVFGQMHAQFLYYLCKSVGYTVSMHHEEQGDRNVISLKVWLVEGDYPLSNRVRRIIDLGQCHDFVYDLQTRNHHFQAGVGEMIVHNTDGSHIKGLVINFIDTFWPELLRVPGFMQEFITPIVKVKRAGYTPICFYTIPEYETWLRQNNNGAGWEIKYYKGLGTSTAAEAKEYFSDLKRHQLTFEHTGKACQKALLLAFAKDQVTARKDWLSNFVPGTFLDQSQGAITIYDFVHKELILFSNASNQRAIPSMMDGLKPGQRKILWVCFRRNLVREIKVAQLAGAVSEKSGYHHGEQSLNDTIVGMAQDYVGAANLNLLMPQGMFGTRAAGGHDAASPRYIFTHLSTLARKLFPQADDPLLTYLQDDGQSVEPQYYVPIFPCCLVFGVKGIGTGHSTDIPNFDPRDVIANIKRKLSGEALEAMHPQYRNFTGPILKIGDQKYVSCGVIKKLDDTTLIISELPIGVWTNKYKLQVIAWQQAGEIDNFNEYHTDTHVSFVIYVTREQMKKYQRAGFYKRFKLMSPINTSNMVAFDPQDQLKKYEDALAIIEEFYPVRLEFYRRRKVYLIAQMEAKLRVLSNRVRFIRAINSEEMEVRDRPKKEIFEHLVEDGYDPIPLKHITKSGKASELDGEEVGDGADPVPEEEEEEPSKGKKRKARAMDDEEDEPVQKKRKNGKNASSGAPQAVRADYDYLLNMNLYSLTYERVQKLLAEHATMQADLDAFRAMAIEDLWTHDLDAFLDALDDYERAQTAEPETVVVVQDEDAAPRSKNGRKKKGKKARKVNIPDWIHDGTLIPPPQVVNIEDVPAPLPDSPKKSKSKSKSVEHESDDEGYDEPVAPKKSRKSKKTKVVVDDEDDE